MGGLGGVNQWRIFVFRYSNALLNYTFPLQGEGGSANTLRALIGHDPNNPALKSATDFVKDANCIMHS